MCVFDICGSLKPNRERSGPGVLTVGKVQARTTLWYSSCLFESVLGLVPSKIYCLNVQPGHAGQYEARPYICIARARVEDVNYLVLMF
jgi:hypothetical protein